MYYSIKKLFYLTSIFLIVAAFLFTFQIGCSFAMPAFSGPTEIKQPNGAKLNVKIKGDEWFNWVEDSNGNVIVKNPKDNFWYYAVDSADEKPAPSFNKAGIDLAPQDVKKSVNINHNTSPTKISHSQSFLRNTIYKAPANPTQPILVILVEFNDRLLSTSENIWASKVFSTTGKTVRTYYREVSNSQYDFIPATETQGTLNDGVIKVHLNYNHPNTGSEITSETLQIVKDALTAADSRIDYQSYDTDQNGYIDSNELHIITIVAGYERSYSAQSPSIWAHKFTLDFIGCPTLDNVMMCRSYYGGGYTQMAELHADHSATIGTACHELAHDLGLPDLYDTDSSSEGVGPHCLMGSGGWCKSSSDTYPGETPSHISAWGKIELGFSDPTTITNGQYTVNSTSQSNYNILKIPTSNPLQYFLIENRQLFGFDAGLQYFWSQGKGGIAIWHIDESVISSNRPYNTINDNETHKGVDLEEANGRALDFPSPIIDSNYSHYYYSGGNDNFGPLSAPQNSYLYNGDSSGVNIQVLSTPANSMTVSYTTVTDLPNIELFSEGAETLSADWITTPENSWGKSTIISSSGNYSWKPVYDNNADYCLVSPSINLNGYSEALLTFKSWHEIEPGYDYGFIEISTDNGVNWDTLMNFTSFSYDNWVTETISLRPYTGNQNIKIRFRLVSDETYSSDSFRGWYVDDIAVKVDSSPVTSASLSASPASPKPVGTSITLTASSSGSSNPYYQFYASKDGGAWTILKAYSSQNNCSWTPSAAGTYTLAIWAKDAYSTQDLEGYAEIQYTVTTASSAVTSASLSASPASPSPAGTNITLTASSSGSSNPYYQFYASKDGGAWTILKAYSSQNTCSWTPSAAGTYVIAIWAKDALSTQDLEGYAEIQYTVTTASSAVTSASLSASPASPKPVGTSITLTASSSGSSNPYYQFYASKDGGAWTILKAYSSQNNCSWTPSAAGTYTLAIWAKDAYSTQDLEGYAEIQYTVTTASSAVTSASLSASPASPSPAGTNITVTASSSGSSNPYYQFYASNDGGAWTMLKAYSSQNTCSWTPSAAGTYTLAIWAKDASSTQDLEGYAEIHYTVTTASSAVTSANLSASPASPSPAGTNITLTASSSGSSNPYYQFYASKDGGAWTTLKAYSSQNTCSWTPSTAGTYTLAIWAKDAYSTQDLEGYAEIQYTVTSASSAVTSASLSASPSSPRPAGTTITLTASSSGSSNPYYQFFASNDNGASWEILKAYSSQNTCTWTPSTAGSYTLAIWAKDVASSATLEGYAQISYTVSASSLPAAAPDESTAFNQEGLTTDEIQELNPANQEQSSTIKPEQSTSIDDSTAYETDDSSPINQEESAPADLEESNPITSASLYVNPVSPLPVETTIELTASSIGSSNPYYQFWVSKDGGAWEILQAYSSQNTCSWTPSSAGTYALAIYAKDAYSAQDLEGYAEIQYIVTTASSAVTSANPYVSPESLSR